MLDVLLSDLGPGSLSEIGELALAVELEHALLERGRALDGSMNAPTVEAIVIGGLPRTGTTYLHHLLAGLLPHRVLRGWEAFSPSASADPATRLQALREASDRYQAAADVSPKLHNMHSLRADGIEECTPLLQRSFECLQWAMMIHAPSYLDRLLSSSFEATYRLWAAQLALVDPSASWLLKSPLHFYAYGALADAAPGVRVVHIRRRVNDMMCSFLNLALEARRLFHADVDPAELGRFWITWLPQFLDKAEQELGAVASRLVVVDYEALVERPVHTARSILERLELPAGDVGNPLPVSQTPYDRLDLSMFGIDGSAVRQAFADHLGGTFLRA